MARFVCMSVLASLAVSPTLPALSAPVHTDTFVRAVLGESIEAYSSAVVHDSFDPVKPDSSASSNDTISSLDKNTTYVEAPLDFNVSIDNVPETLVVDQSLGDDARFENPFGLDIPQKLDPYQFSHKKHCDVLRHLKVPATYRRLDSYMRPHYILKKKSTDKTTSYSDQFLSFQARQDLYKQGVDVYGCYALDFAADIVGNTSKNPIASGSGPWQDWQGNSMLIVGLDVYSRLINKNWKGGQWHASFTFPQAINNGPLYSYGNTLNPAGLGTRQYLGYFYTDVGRSRDANPKMQGLRIFENWFQQSWGPMNLNYVRVGQINPWITFNRSLAAGIFSYWSFDEPGIIGTTPITANGPLVTTAPPGVSVALQFGDNVLVKAMAASGYWDPSGGIDNRRGYNWYLDFDHWGIEYLYEITWRGGTYSLNSKDNGNPWFVRLGGQYHSGMGLNNLYTNDGGYYFPANGCDESLATGEPNACNVDNSEYANRKKYWGNSQYYFMAEGMLYREPGSYNRGLTAWFKAKYSPWDYKGSSTKGLYGGLVYEGIGSRDHDLLYFGYSHMLFNKGVYERAAVQNACVNMPHCGVSQFQGVFELGYSMQLTPYFFVQPKLFYVMNPNIRTDLGDIFTAGVELRLSY